MVYIMEHAFSNELRVVQTNTNFCQLNFQWTLKKTEKNGVIFTIQAVLSLYSICIFTGIVTNSEFVAFHFVPMFDGYSSIHADISLDLTELDLSE